MGGANFVMTLNGGSVGIGTQNPDMAYKLSVNGKIRAKEIKMEAGWADFVFARAGVPPFTWRDS